MGRKTAAEKVQEQVLTQSARRCAFCYGFDGNLKRVEGQIAHVDRNNQNSSFENLVWLCLDHHNEYDTRRSQSKGLMEREVRNYRARLYDAIQAGLHHTQNERIAPVRNDYLEHDRAAFNAGNAILNETDLRDVLEQLGSEHLYYRGRWKPVGKFVEHFSTETARYIISDLLPPLDNLLVHLSSLIRFVTTSFFIYPNRQPSDDENLSFCMYPDHNVDREGSGTDKEWGFYNTKSHELLEIIWRIEEAFAEYRRTIKRTLAV